MNLPRIASIAIAACALIATAPTATADTVALYDDNGNVIVDMSACPVAGWNVYTDQAGNAYVRYCTADQN